MIAHDIDIPFNVVLEGKISTMEDFEIQFKMSRSVTFRIIKIYKRKVLSLLIIGNKEGSLNHLVTELKEISNNKFFLEFIINNAPLLREINTEAKIRDEQKFQQSHESQSRLPLLKDLHSLGVLVNSDGVDEVAKWVVFIEKNYSDFSKLNSVESAIVKLLSWHEYASIKKNASAAIVRRAREFLDKHQTDFKHAPARIRDPLQNQIDNAITLLNKHGYVVTKPSLG